MKGRIRRKSNLITRRKEWEMKNEDCAAQEKDSGNEKKKENITRECYNPRLQSTERWQFD